MLTEFTFDEEFFSSSCLHDENLSISHDYIISTWCNFGVLVLPKSKAQEFYELVKKLPPKFRQRWNDAISDNKIHYTNDCWDSFCSYDDFVKLRTLNSFFKTGLTQEITGQIFSGNDDSKIRCQASGFEILGAGVASESENFNQSLIAATSEIEKDSIIENVWEEKFSLLAKYSKNITIIDRYFFARTMEDIVAGRSSTSIKKFIQFLSSANKKFNLKIISAGGANESQESIEICNYYENKIFGSAPLRKSLSRLTLVSNEEIFFQDFAHERFIKFDDHVCKIGVGMQIFEKRSLPYTDFSVKPVAQTYFSAREKESRKKSLWRKEFDE